jgi:rare lipoprotein A
MNVANIEYVQQSLSDLLFVILQNSARNFFLTAIIVCSVSSLSAQNEILCEFARATFYSNKFEGNKCANGTVFRQSGFTAAHCDLKFGTKVKVTNLKNDSSVLVVITDRLPRKAKCRIDLTLAAAKKLNFINAGWAKVKIEIWKDSLP